LDGIQEGAVANACQAVEYRGRDHGIAIGPRIHPPVLSKNKKNIWPLNLTLRQAQLSENKRETKCPRALKITTFYKYDFGQHHNITTSQQLKGINSQLETIK
jgi:hypothetical protein